MTRLVAGSIFLTALMYGAVEWLGAQEPTISWKRDHVVDNRIEGFEFERGVGQGSLGLVAFHAHYEEIDFALQDRLTIEFFASQPSHVKFIARELTPVLHYWMEARSHASDGVNRWSEWTTEVLRRAKNPISPANLGLVVRLGERPADTDRADGHVAPAILRRSNSALPEQISSYNVTFLPDADLKEVSFKVFEGCDPTLRAIPGAEGRYFNQYKDTPLTIIFSAGHAGPTTLRVTYTNQGKKPEEPPALNYCFWHVRNPRDSAQLRRGAP